MDDVVRAFGGEVVEAGAVAPGGDHALGSKMLGNLDGHRSGVAGGAVHQDRLPGPKRHPGTQRGPRRQGRVHGGDQKRGVGSVRNGDGGGRVDCDALGQGTRAHWHDEGEAAVGPADHGVGAGQGRQCLGAGVVLARGDSFGGTVHADGQDIHQFLTWGGLRRGDGAEVRRLVE
ncbi:hypothetical protein [Streptomyces tendae]|uniref:hypothetical protein n=1 Tax=Streptomyces tendae TaxID=1932 RepID=UPI003803B6D9